MLEITTVFGTRKQSAHVKGVDNRLSQDFRHVFLGDAPCEAFSDGRFTHAGFTHQERVVFASAAQDLDGALDFVLATNKGVDLSVFGELVEVLGELLQRRSFFTLFGGGALFLLTLICLRAFSGFGRIALFDAVGDEVDHVQTGHALLVEVVDGVRVFLTKDSDQHIGARHFFFAITCGLHMHDGALDDALKTERGLGIDFFGACNLRRVVFDEIGQRLAQIVDIGRASAQHFGGAGVV